MSNRTLNLDDTLYRYLLDVSLREHPVLAELRTATQTHPRSNMQIAQEQGQFMALLIRLLGARRALEIGTFTGYSALAVALALPDDGQLITCDIDAGTTTLAQEYWQRAGVDHKIDLRLAPALQTLDSLVAEGQAGTFDFIFIDADKAGYDAYYEHSLQLLHPGGLIAIDNVLWDGKVAHPAEPGDADTRALQLLNEKLHRDERIDLSLLPIADGLTLARKR
ncbi:class I SAM-dependent methyltransferase [Oxalicibacterium solurbis]|uniref:O-methyltransferase n=1 Tax=Oxalicibacterium solurbis TaxID=69280 RepID=A0A8J3AXH7_9BURK|nr:class I SAM-dependent methyltransferase [Oxalicibacterium solurbis]GGI54727.1 O-methyltransferase [Oxalicibacterium solurbis]